MLPEQLDLIAGTRRAPAVTLDGPLEDPNTVAGTTTATGADDV